MANKVNKHKVKLLKKELLKGNSIKDSMLNIGYKETTANRGTANTIYQEAFNQIQSEIRKEDVTVERVLTNLYEDRELARKKKDISTMTRVDELLGKFLSMYTERIESKAVITNEQEDTLNKLLRR